MSTFNLDQRRQKAGEPVKIMLLFTTIFKNGDVYDCFEVRKL
jgi:hypothetical protein